MSILHGCWMAKFWVMMSRSISSMGTWIKPWILHGNTRGMHGGSIGITHFTQILKFRHVFAPSMHGTHAFLSIGFYGSMHPYRNVVPMHQPWVIFWQLQYRHDHVVSTTPTVNSIWFDLEFTFNTFDIGAMMGRFRCIISEETGWSKSLSRGWWFGFFFPQQCAAQLRLQKFWSDVLLSKVTQSSHNSLQVKTMPNLA